MKRPDPDRRDGRDRETRLRSLVENSPSAVCLKDLSGRFVLANRAFAQWYGFDHAAVVGRRTREIWAPAVADEFEALDRAVVETGAPVHEQVRFDTPEHGTRHLLTTRFPVTDEAGGMLGVGIVDTDISDHVEAERARRESEARYRTLVENAPVCIHELNLDGELTSMNPAGVRMLGLATESEVCGMRYLDAVSEPEREAIGRLLERACAGEASTFEFSTGGEQPRVFASSFIPIRDESGVPVKLMGLTADITGERHAKAELERKSTVLEVTLEHMEQGISMVDDELRAVAFNRRFLELLDFPPDRFAQGDPFEKFIRYNAERGEYGPGDRDRLVAERVALARRFDPHHMRRARPDGTVIEIRGNPVPGGGFVSTYTDVTETHRLSEQLTHQATHDALTGLANRWAFEHRLREVLDADDAAEAHHAICYIDLDQFKVINDTCGHVAGDALLSELGALLGQQVRKRDMFARLGGDEFGLLMEDCDLAQAERIAGKLCSTVDGFKFVWQGKTFKIGASIGLVPISGGQTVGDVLSAADAACYVAKDRGRARVHVYQPDDADVARRYGEMQWVARINQALEDDAFRLHVQRIEPLAAAPGGARPGILYEVLVRMQDVDGTLVAPRAFLPAVERFNLAPRLDRWVIGNVLRWLGRHWEHLADLEMCSINLSGQSLVDEGLVDYIVERLGPIRPGQLCFEITETALISNLAQARRFIEALQRQGCRFALDDFGSGLASFAYLKSLPVDFLKIDGVFVRDMTNDPIDAAMVKSINEIGHVMGKRTIAEFVEDERVRASLAELGVDFAQGYAIHRPEPIEVAFGAGPAPARESAPIST